MDNMNFPDLNPQQKLAVQAPDKPLLIVAGAGTGKTRTLTSRLLYLIVERGVPAHHIIAITFTNKAAKEMAGRVSRLIGELGKLSSFIGTFHSFGAKILRSEARHLGRTPNFVIFDAGDSLQLIKKIINPVRSKPPLAAAVVSPLAGGRTSNGINPVRGRPANPVRNFVSNGAESAATTASGRSASNGMKALGGETKKGFHDRGPVYFAQKISRIKNGVIDPPHNSVMWGVDPNELQNSSKEDAFALKVFERYEQELLRQNAFDFDDLIGKVAEVFREHPEVLEKYRKRFRYTLVDEYQDLNNCQYELIRLLVGDSARISVVGDDQQMIYSFRGSNFNIFLDFENDWPDANVVALEENYRSTANIIKSASALIQQNRYQKPKTLWTKNEEGAPVKIVEAEDENVEAEWIAETISNLQFFPMAKPPRILDKVGTIFKKSIAVLYRTNAQSRAIEQALIERSIPYRIFGGLRFYERKEIKDIVAALRIIQNPKDEVSHERLEKNLSKGRFLKFRELLKSERRFAPSELISTFLGTTGYLELLEKNFSNSEDRKENIAELLNFASGFTDLAPFLEQIALLQPMDDVVNGTGDMRHGKRRLKNEKSGDNNPLSIYHSTCPVHLMTIHLAKGLEFDAVFVAGCSEGILPHNRSLGSEAELEEERRLMYVAMTRARKELFLSFYDIPSRFLGELPTELTEFKSLSSEDQKTLLDIDSEERYITLD